MGVEHLILQLSDLAVVSITFFVGFVPFPGFLAINLIKGFGLSTSAPLRDTEG